MLYESPFKTESILPLEEVGLLLVEMKDFRTLREATKASTKINFPTRPLIAQAADFASLLTLRKLLDTDKNSLSLYYVVDKMNLDFKDTETLFKIKNIELKIDLIKKEAEHFLYFTSKHVAHNHYSKYKLLDSNEEELEHSKFDEIQKKIRKLYSNLYEIHYPDVGWVLRDDMRIYLP